MLARFDGFTIDLSRLGQPSLPSPEILVGTFGGDWVLILPKSAARDALEKLLDLGMKGFSFATLTGNRKITILGETRLTENADFLRSLIRPCPELSLVLQATASTAPAISHHPQIGYFCPFLPNSEAFSETSEISGMQASSASALLTEGAFSTAILTALAPILACTLSGVGYSEMRLAVDLALPMRGFTALPASFAAAIGLYRVQAELGIPAAQTRISEKEINAPILSVFSAGKGIKTLAGTLRGADSKVYLIPVQLSSEGLPDFAALRLLLADLCAQAKNDVIRSARLVLQKAPKTVLTEMQSETLRATPTVSPEKLSEPLPLGILLESIYEMPFEQVATVSVCDAASVNPVETPDPFRIPKGNGLIPRERPEAVLYAPADCPDAIAIARFLRQRDISVSIFDPREKESFLRAVLTASVVYHLPGATLPKGKKADFAFSVLRQNGGEIRSLKQLRRKKAVRS